MKLTGKYDTTKSYFILTGEFVFTELDKFLTEASGRSARFFILADENTREHCLPILLSQCLILKDAEIIGIPSGEKNKSIETAVHLWRELMKRHADRQTLLINLGGGVISDLGGFVASTFQRGIPYINIPTTLMAQTDAAIGGKTGLNLGDVKNQVGTFQFPEAVFIHDGFLKTLPKQHIKNGFAEIIKYALIEDSVMWAKLRKLNLHDLLLGMGAGDLSLGELVERSIKIKYDIVEKDFHEEHSRKLLNFGHTFGHALEAFSMKDSEEGLHHGHAVALGILFESWLSFRLTGLPEDDMKSIQSMILSNYNYFPVDGSDSDRLIEIMAHDKKNHDRKLCFTLLQRPGKAIIDQYCEVDLIYEVLNFYRSLHNVHL
jgi:3-dehydroquinate synthase